MKRLYHFVLTDKNIILAFLIVGSITAIINFISFSICYSIFNLYYQLAVSIAFAIGVIFHFNANRCFTFKSRAIHFKYQIPKYVVLLIISYCMTLFVTYTVVEVMGLSPYIGYLSAIGVTVIFNYLLSRFWVFKKRGI